MKRFIVVLIVFLSLNVYAVVNVPSDHWSYNSLNRLVNGGLVDAGYLSVKPLNRLQFAYAVKDAIKSIQENKQAYPESVQQDLNALIMEYMKELQAIKVKVLESPVDLKSSISLNFFYPLRFDLVYLKDTDRFSYNNAGITYADKFGGMFSTYAWFNFENVFGIDFLPLLYVTDGPLDKRINEVAAAIDIFGIAIEAGRESICLDGGLSGSLVLSGNADPINLVKVKNNVPIDLAVGKVFLTAFYGSLNNTADPYITGFRGDLSLLKYLNVGLSYVNTTSGYTMLGYSLTAILPFSIYSVCNGLRVSGEFASKSGFDNPSYIAGVDVLDLFQFEGLDFAFEYINASNDLNAVLNGRSIGYFTGSGTNTYYVELKQRLSDNMTTGLNYTKSNILSNFVFWTNFAISRNVFIDFAYLFNGYNTENSHLIKVGLSTYLGGLN